MTKRRALVFTGDIFRFQERGGISRYFLELIARLERPAEVIVGLHQSRVISALGRRAVAAARLPRIRGITRPRALMNRLLDQVHLHGRRGVILHPTYYRRPAGLPSGEPLVVTVYDMAHERFPALFGRPWWSAADPAGAKAELCACADRVVCISEATRRDVIEMLRVPAERTRTIYCGAPDWSALGSVPHPGIAGPFFLWVGERTGYKNFAATLTAWASCREAAGTMLVCVGGGSFDPDERAAMGRLGVAGRVRRVSCPDSQLRWLYERAVGLLSTSLWEGFGLPVLEAMALGCPVVAADRGAVPEIAGEPALYVDPSDSDSLRDGIARCLARGRGADQAYALRRQALHFTWDECAAAHEALYRELD